MKRIKSYCFFSLLFSLSISVASENLFTEGVHYQLISPAVPTETDQGQVEVVELFWYGCRHCYDLEPYIEEWLKTKPKSLEFIRLPATLNPGWVNHARTYFALESIGELQRLHPLLFLAIHEQGRRLRDIHSITRFLTQQGVDKDKFLEAYESLEVQSKLNRTSWLNQEYGVTGVPVMVVNGKYLSSASMVGSYDKLFDVVNFLAEKEIDGQK